VFIHSLVSGLWHCVILLVDINIPEPRTPYIFRVKVGLGKMQGTSAASGQGVEPNTIKWEQCMRNVTKISPFKIHRTVVSRSSHRAPFPVVQTGLYYHFLWTIPATRLLYNLSLSHPTHFEPKVDAVASFKTFAYANKALKSWKQIPEMI
jgi:hypothetical protein